MNDPQQPGQGNPDSIYRAPSSDTSVAPEGDLLSAYVGPKNSAYYLGKFERFERGGGNVSWHWPAFFLTSFWLLYRKMWLNAALYWFVLPISLSIVAGIAGSLSGNPESAAITTAAVYYGLYILLTFIVVPIYANWLYFRHAQKKVDKVTSQLATEQQQAAELARIGGTSKIVLVILPIILIVLIGIIAAIAIPAYQDYTIRAQVSQGLTLASSVKSAVNQRYADSGAIPSDLDTSQISGNYVTSVAYGDGDIVVTYGNEAHDLISGTTLVLRVMPEESPEWVCFSNEIAATHLPAACR